MSGSEVGSVWWVGYRKSLTAPRARMNKEMILRSSIRAAAREYMTNSSLSGVSYLVDEKKSKKERTFWLLVILVAGVAILNILWVSWSDFVSKPIIVSLESHDNPIRNVPFPAVALCNVNRISRKAAEEYAHKLHPMPNHTLEELKQQIYRMGRLLDYEVDGHNQLLPFMEYIDSHPDPDGLSIADRMKQCEDMLLRCSWAGKPYNCSELFSFRRTTNGFCCNFNNVRFRDDNGHTYLEGEVKRQSAPGLENGLFVLADPLLHDYAYSLHNSLGIDILVFDGTNFPDRGSGRMLNRLLEPDSVLFLILESWSVEETMEVRKYSAETRGCRFRDELPEQFEGLYSYTSCIMACRIRTVQSLCKCVPFFLPRFSGDSVTCTLYDLPCLDKYREKLLYIFPSRRSGDAGLELELEDALSCPECLPDCNYTQYATRAFELNLQHPMGKNFPYEFVAGVDMVNKTVLAVFHESTTSKLYRMDVVFYWFELVSNLGGIAGVFVGYSIISVVEIFYFFVIRFYFILRETTDKYYY